MKKILIVFIFFIFTVSYSQETLNFKFTNLDQIEKKELKNVKTKTDEFNGATFISPKGFMNESYRIDPYLVYENEEVTFRIRFKYYGSYWVFHDKVLIKVCNEIRDFEVAPNREVAKGQISEISDIKLNLDDIEFLRKVANANYDVPIRYEGEKNSDQKLYSIERNYLKKILDFFDKFKK